MLTGFFQEQTVKTWAHPVELNDRDAPQHCVTIHSFRTLPVVDNRSEYSLLIPRRTAAASALPPANPAAIGIFLRILRCTGCVR